MNDAGLGILDITTVIVIKKGLRRILAAQQRETSQGSAGGRM